MSLTSVIFGAGNIGRGFVGQLFSELGYDVVFVDVDESLVDALNARGSYTIRLVDNDFSEAVTIAPVRALRAGDRDAVAGALAEAAIAATAVGVRVLPHVAPAVAAGIARRAAAGNPAPLNIILCENMKGAASAFRSMVQEHLPAHLHGYLAERVGIVNTVIGRMVPPLTPEMRAEDPTLIVVEPYKELPVDREGLVNPVPAIVGMEPCDNFAAYTARKLYIHNCGHAVLAYLGYLAGHEYGYQALVDPAIRAQFDAALGQVEGEHRRGLRRRNGLAGRAHRRPDPPLRQPHPGRHNPASWPRPSTQAQPHRPAGRRGAIGGAGRCDAERAEQSYCRRLLL